MWRRLASLSCFSLALSCILEGIRSTAYAEHSKKRVFDILNRCFILNLTPFHWALFKTSVQFHKFFRVFKFLCSLLHCITQTKLIFLYSQSIAHCWAATLTQMKQVTSIHTCKYHILMLQEKKGIGTKPRVFLRKIYLKLWINELCSCCLWDYSSKSHSNRIHKNVFEPSVSDTFVPTFLF